MIARTLSVAVLVAALLASPTTSRAAGDLAQFGYQQRPGNQLPLDAVLRDETGQPVRLGAVIGGTSDDPGTRLFPLSEPVRPAARRPDRCAGWQWPACAGRLFADRAQH